MKKIIIACFLFLLFSCSPHKKILYFEGDTRNGGLSLAFNLETMRYSYWGIGDQGNGSEYSKDGNIDYKVIYFEDKFTIRKGFFRNTYLLEIPQFYYYLPFNIQDDPLYIRTCYDPYITMNNRIEFKKRASGYSLDIRENIYNVDCLKKLRIDGLWGIKRVDKLYLGKWKILDTINFKPLHPDFK